MIIVDAFRDISDKNIRDTEAYMTSIMQLTALESQADRFMIDDCAEIFESVEDTKNKNFVSRIKEMIMKALSWVREKLKEFATKMRERFIRAKVRSNLKAAIKKIKNKSGWLDTISIPDFYIPIALTKKMTGELAKLCEKFSNGKVKDKDIEKFNKFIDKTHALIEGILSNPQKKLAKASVGYLEKIMDRYENGSLFKDYLNDLKKIEDTFKSQNIELDDSSATPGQIIELIKTVTARIQKYEGIVATSIIEAAASLTKSANSFAIGGFGGSHDDHQQAHQLAVQQHLRNAHYFQQQQSQQQQIHNNMMFQQQQMGFM